MTTRSGLPVAAGAHLGVWRPGTLPGFTVLSEPGALSWFELHTPWWPRPRRRLLPFGVPLGHATVAATDQCRYTTMRHPDDGGRSAGIMNASRATGTSTTSTPLWQGSRRSAAR
ncbi:MAG: hypothetical protein QOG45_1121 [Chloroflexota bacterium]|jgi:hypothetical protein|nr:hypothetical protein [Chloroflexota bacterium]